MAEELHIAKGNKEEKYALLYKQIVSLVEGENDTIANMANIAAMIHHTFGFWWTGFYRVVNEELILGPFQGPLACSRIKFGRGVCGTAWEQRTTQVVPDVEQFPGHIACDSASNSEVVIPILINNELYGLLDIDSPIYNRFTPEETSYLEHFVRTLETLLSEIL